mmetsp:Transcript_15343/g.46031  ORF Transcript_15343/g.46031 Transcript_15343/m.46031 type:complete len:252 (-) Transcript_15343:105-860(-)
MRCAQPHTEREQRPGSPFSSLTLGIHSGEQGRTGWSPVAMKCVHQQTRRRLGGPRAATRSPGHVDRRRACRRGGGDLPRAARLGMAAARDDKAAAARARLEPQTEFNERLLADGCVDDLDGGDGAGRAEAAHDVLQQARVAREQEAEGRDVDAPPVRVARREAEAGAAAVGCAVAEVAEEAEVGVVDEERGGRVRVAVKREAPVARGGVEEEVGRVGVEGHRVGAALVNVGQHAANRAGGEAEQVEVGRIG